MPALATAGIVGAVAFSIGSSAPAGQKDGLRAGVAPALPAGERAEANVGASVAKSPAKSSGVSAAYRIPALRNFKRTKANLSAFRSKRAENEEVPFLRVPLEGLSHFDGALQLTQGKMQTPAPDQNFEGINNMCGCLPPDTNGDVGPNHYMQIVNEHFAVWTKTGTQVIAHAHQLGALHGHAALRNAGLRRPGRLL